MALIKCKMCGGDLNYEEGATVCECEYCGSKQTIPNQDNEKKLTLFGRAGRLLRACDFDKAAGIFEQIIAEFPEEAEAYWGLVLCKYGIEYVDDPATGKKIPTCHRSSFESVMDDTNFDQACENADSVARGLYRAEAKQIEELRKGIIEVSANEQPYDIFISYKEKDDAGERTLDSVLAQDIYTALTDKGYRVFFSRISLEDKLGIEYEPYIFAALNSAKVMIVVGTDYDYFNAVWVKNEWGRYLKLMAQDRSKHLIPCFKGIDAYDMPKEFNKLAAQDLGKVGATQDLIRGVEKLLGGAKQDEAGSQKQTLVQQVINNGGPNVDALLKRGYDSLEDQVFGEAKTFFNDALNSNAESAEAYLGLFMAEIGAANQAAAKIKFVAGDYTQNRYYKRARQYASGNLLQEMNQWEEERNGRLQREAEEARRAKEEADRKAREAEEARQKKQKELKSLREQLRTGNFAMTEKEQAEQERLTAAAKSAEETAQAEESAYAESAEVQDAARLESLISSKKTQLAGLGIFKGKEKKELQSQIETLEGNLADAKKKVSEKQEEINRLKKQAEEAKKEAKNYKQKLTSSKKGAVSKQICTIVGLDFSGTTVKFGGYEQGSGIKPIEWLVLEHSESRFLLISKYALECRRYHEKQEDITWEKCDLCKWLNNDFLNTAFDETERSLIAETRCPADRNPRYATNPGNDTRDKVFLLSIPEAQRYFKSDEDRKTTPAAYAKKQGASTSSSYSVGGSATCWWWLRSPGYVSSRAAYVFSDGSVYYRGGDVYYDSVCVRPALWINLES